MFTKYGNGFKVLCFSFVSWRDTQTLHDVQWAWYLGDIQNLINIPIPFTKYTFSITK